MPTIAIKDLTGSQLDWAVATAEGEEAVIHGGVCQVVVARYEKATHYTERTYHNNPYRAWPIIDRDGISVWSIDGTWSAGLYQGVFGGSWPSIDCAFGQDGPTGLIAAMRCRVAMHFGQTVDVPEPL